MCEYDRDTDGSINQKHSACDCTERKACEVESIIVVKVATIL